MNNRPRLPGYLGVGDFPVRTGNNQNNRYNPDNTNIFLGGRGHTTSQPLNELGRTTEYESLPPSPSRTNVIPGNNSESIISGEDENIANTILHKHTLDDYVSTKYNIRLSLLGDINTIETTRENLMNIEKKYFIASSDITNAGESYGENRTDTQYLIKSLNFKTINSMTLNNPETPNSTMFKMEIEEPYGFSLDREIRHAAASLGYTVGFPASRFVFRLDIWFSGYKEDGTFVEKIPVINLYPSLSATNVQRPSSPFGSPALSDDIDGQAGIEVSGNYQTIDTFSYFVNIIQINSELSNGNSTRYELDMIPTNDLVMYPEYDALHMFNITLGESEGNSTFGEYIQEFERVLNDTFTFNDTTTVPLEEIKRLTRGDNRTSSTAEELFEGLSGTETVFRNYQFIVEDQELWNAVFDELPENSDETSATRFNVESNSIRADIIEKVTRTSYGRKHMIGERQEDGSYQVQYPREIFVVRTEIDYNNSSIYAYSGDLINITLKYYIERKREYRYIPSNYNDLQTWSRNREARAMEIVQSGALKKVYKYVYSGDNTVVKSFNINANVFWHAINSDPHADIRFHSLSTSVNETEEQDQTIRRFVPVHSTAVAASALESITHGTSTEENIFPYRSTVLPFFMRRQANSFPDTSVSQENLIDYSRYQEQLERFLRVQSVSLEGLEIRGEPQWLSSLHNIERPVNTNAREFETSLGTDIIYLKLVYPEQSEYMNPESNYSEPILKSANYGGFYQVITVENKFEGGLFTQTFTGHRLSQEIGLSNDSQTDS